MVSPWPRALLLTRFGYYEEIVLAANPANEWLGPAPNVTPQG